MKDEGTAVRGNGGGSDNETRQSDPGVRGGAVHAQVRRQDRRLRLLRLRAALSEAQRRGEIDAHTADSVYQYAELPDCTGLISRLEARSRAADAQYEGHPRRGVVRPAPDTEAPGDARPGVEGGRAQSRRTPAARRRAHRGAVRLGAGTTPARQTGSAEEAREALHGARRDPAAPPETARGHPGRNGHRGDDD
jgi:hypothetical protein